jgi:glycosyltransferase involved in cell wall biosynthesis
MGDATADDAPAFSIIIPAHNEAAVILRCLETIQLRLPQGRVPPQIILVCNGCSDNTADLARANFPQVEVIELAQGSKPLALNAGNARAKAATRIFLDADVIVDGHALTEVADVLSADNGIEVAAPAMRIDLAHSSPLVRAFYRAWQATPYINDGMVGSGLFGLSAGGMARVGAFPPIIADDSYVRNHFALSERKSVAYDAQGEPVSFTIFPPRDMASLVRVMARRRVGDLQLFQLVGPPPVEVGTSDVGFVATKLWRRVALFDYLTYATVKLVARVWGRAMFHNNKPAEWLRDDSSRVA